MLKGSVSLLVALIPSRQRGLTTGEQHRNINKLHVGAILIANLPITAIKTVTCTNSYTVAPIDTTQPCPPLLSDLRAPAVGFPALRLVLQLGQDAQHCKQASKTEQMWQAFLARQHFLSQASPGAFKSDTNLFLSSSQTLPGKNPGEGPHLL